MFILSSVERTSWEERLVRYERTDMGYFLVGDAFPRPLPSLIRTGPFGGSFLGLAGPRVFPLRMEAIRLLSFIMTLSVCKYK